MQLAEYRSCVTGVESCTMMVDEGSRLAAY
jgi:hypothetical protein